VWGKASHASADPKEIASDEYAAKISTCKHRKCRECPLSRVYKQAAQKADSSPLKRFGMTKNDGHIGTKTQQDGREARPA